MPRERREGGVLVVHRRYAPNGSDTSTSGGSKQRSLATIKAFNRHDFLQSFQARVKKVNSRPHSAANALYDDVEFPAEQSDDEDIPTFLNSARLDAHDMLDGMEELRALFTWVNDIRAAHGCNISFLDVDLRNGIALLEALYVIAPELFERQSGNQDVAQPCPDPGMPTREASKHVGVDTRTNKSTADFKTGEMLNGWCDVIPERAHKISVSNLCNYSDLAQLDRHAPFDEDVEVKSEAPDRPMEMDVIMTVSSDDADDKAGAHDPASPPPSRPQSQRMPKDSQPQFSILQVCGVERDLDEAGKVARRNVDRLREAMGRFTFHDWNNRGKCMGEATFHSVDLWQLAGYVLLIAVNGPRRQEFVSHLLQYDKETRELLEAIVQNALASFGMRTTPIEDEMSCDEAEQIRTEHEMSDETQPVGEMWDNSRMQDNNYAQDDAAVPQHGKREGHTTQDAQNARIAESRSKEIIEGLKSDLDIWMRVAQRNKDLVETEHDLRVRLEDKVLHLEQEHALRQTHSEQLENLVNQVSLKLDNVRAENRRLKEENRNLKRNEADLIHDNKELRATQAKCRECGKNAGHTRPWKEPLAPDTRLSRWASNAQTQKLRNENASLRRRALEYERALANQEKEAVKAVKEVVRALKDGDQPAKKTNSLGRRLFSRTKEMLR